MTSATGGRADWMSPASRERLRRAVRDHLAEHGEHFTINGRWLLALLDRCDEADRPAAAIPGGDQPAPADGPAESEAADD